MACGVAHGNRFRVGVSLGQGKGCDVLQVDEKQVSSAYCQVPQIVGPLTAFSATLSADARLAR